MLEDNVVFSSHFSYKHKLFERFLKQVTYQDFSGSCFRLEYEKTTKAKSSVIPNNVTGKHYPPYKASTQS